MSHLPDRSACIDESAWLYLAAPQRSEAAIADAMSELCHAVGWDVYRPEGRGAEPRRREHALRHADAVIADLSADDSDTIEDLLAARRAGRPILALRPADRSAPAVVRDLLDGYDRAVILAWSKPQECLRRAAATLTAASWRALVRDAMPASDA